jgi:putative oxidoreductase
MTSKNRVSAFLGSRVVQFLARLALGGIFIYASIDKIAHPLAFARILASYRLLPAIAIHGAAAVLPWVEFVAGASLILGVCRRSAALLLTLLLAMFILVAGISVLRGLNLDCGCFTTAGGPPESPFFVILRDLLILVPALIVLFFERPSAGKS